MGKSKILRILAIVGILSLLFVLIPATSALALPEITISPTSGSVGTEVTVTGTGFESFSGTEISIFFNNREVDNSPLVIPESGTFTTDFAVPSGARPGTAYVKVTTVIGGEVRRSFIVQEPKIGLSADEGAVGTMVTVDGQGFYAGGTVDLYYYKDGSRVNVASETASPTGEFTYTFPIPDSTAGEHKIMGEDALDNSAEVSFEVVSAITISPSSGAIGDKVTVSGTGFGSRNDVTVYFNSIAVAGDTANKYGSFEVTFAVPATVSGTYDIEAEEDDDDNKGRAEFTVVAGASLSQSTGAVGTPLVVSGVGFNAGTLVTITYDGVELATATAGSDGAFSAAFNAPASTGGNHIITVTDGTNIAECIFTMESKAPPAPALLSPEDGAKAEAKAHFDWEGVDDPSGITYTLQVATKDSFTASFLVLEREGLTDSKYAITPEEELEPASREAPYYWRVKAIDGASNESEWSAVSSFYVTSPFTLSPTVRNVLIGVGVTGAVFFGFWLGRRTAYSRRVS